MVWAREGIEAEGESVESKEIVESVGEGKREKKMEEGAMKQRRRTKKGEQRILNWEREVIFFCNKGLRGYGWLSIAINNNIIKKN